MKNKMYAHQMAVAAAQNKKERNYWTAKMAGELERSSFPYDYKQNNPEETPMETIQFTFQEPLFTKLIRLSNDYDYTLYMILTAALIALLDKYTYGGSGDILVGAPVYKGEKNMEGDFINYLLPFRNQLQENTTFKELLLQVKQTIVEADEHQNYPMDGLAEELGQPAPLFETAVLLENIQDKHHLQHIPLNMIFAFHRTPSCIKCCVQYSPHRYLEQTVARISLQYQRLLEQALNNVNVPVMEIDLLTKAEKTQLTEDFNRNEINHSPRKTIDELFVEQVNRVPRKAAVVCEGQQITYKQLQRKSEQLAVFLRSEGVEPGVMVGIMAERSLEMIIGILGILKAGGAYLPVSPHYPEERKRYMIADSNMKLLFTACRMSADYGIRTINRNSVVDSGAPSLEKLHCPASPSYVMYTSGSTGKPKGVVVQHRNVVRLVKNTNYIKFQEDDRILQTGALEFDASTFEIWGALLNGLTLYLANKENLLNGPSLLKTIREHNITTMWMTSPLFNRMVQEDVHIFESLKYLIVGGDQLSPHHINQVRNHAAQLQIINGYGPTENTTFSTTFAIEKEYRENIPIGRPISGSSAYILDKYRRLQPVGMAGELWVSGDGVAAGYLNDPLQTAEKFIENNFHRTENRLYRTGDLARWLSTGNIEFLGRIDQQVKIRGFRIEPQEIEKQLLDHHQIREAVVIVKVDKKNDKYLCAYFVSHRQAAASSVREFLSQRLPDYMVPAFFVQIEQIPLTANGKVDKKMLPEPEAGNDETYIPPDNELEETLAVIWSEVLDTDKERIGRDSNFFQLGGHSLKAAQLISSLHHHLNIDVPLGEILKHLTIKSQADYIKCIKKRETHPAIEKIAEKEYYPVSYNQERLWISNQLHPGSSEYNMPVKVVFNEQVNEEFIKEALLKLAERHESLRTGFKTVAGKPVQYVAMETDIPLKSVDLSTLTSREKQIQRENIFAKEISKPFELSAPPLFRVLLVKVAEEEYDFIFTIHHIISDGWSMQLLEKDFLQIYHCIKNSEAVHMEPLTLQYKDFSAWNHIKLNDKNYKEKASAYWREKLKDEQPLTAFPADFKVNGDNRRGAGYKCVVNQEIKERLKETADHYDTTMFTVMLAVFNILMARFSKEEQVSCTVPVFGRDKREFMHIAGFFVNTVILINTVPLNEPFQEFLQRTRENTSEAFGFQDYPIEKIFKDLKMKMPEIPVFFNMINLDDARVNEPLPSMADSHQPELNDIKFKLLLYVTEHKDGILLNCNYRKALYKPETIEYFFKEYTKLLDFFTRNPHKSFKEYKRKKKRILKQINQIKAEVTYAY